MRVSFLLALAMAGVGVPGTLGQDREREFHQEWLDMDLEMVRLMRPVLEDPPRRIEELVKALDASRVDLDRDSGFHSRQIQRVRYGGYTSCWIHIAPAGRAAMEELFDDGQLDLLRHALRGLNPEGRLYAAEAMLRLQKGGTLLTQEDRAAIEIIRCLPVPIGVCSGCFVTRSTAREILDELGL